MNSSTTQQGKALVLHAVAAVWVLLALSGCGSDAADAGGETSPGVGTSSSAASATNDADVHFAQSMVPHLDQAVQMSIMLLAKPGVDPDVKAVAKQIKATQEPHIDTLNQWLEAWGRPFGSDDGSEDVEEGGTNHHSGNGLMSPGQMESLGIADAADGRRLFLEGMIKHHYGAVAMAETEIKNGQHPEAVELARSIVTDQNHEITTMHDLLTGR